MSALIAALTLTPLALGLSRGAGLQRALATTTILRLGAAVPLAFLPAPMLAPGQSARAERRFARR